MFALDGKVCVVTGALGLIGRELARALAEAGGRVVLTDLDHGACVDRAHGLGGEALGHGADITQPESLASLLAGHVAAGTLAGALRGKPVEPVFRRLPGMTRSRRPG